MDITNTSSSSFRIIVQYRGVRKYVTVEEGISLCRLCQLLCAKLGLPSTGNTSTVLTLMVDDKVLSMDHHVHSALRNNTLLTVLHTPTHTHSLPTPQPSSPQQGHQVASDSNDQHLKQVMACPAIITDPIADHMFLSIWEQPLEQVQPFDVMELCTTDMEARNRILKHWKRHGFVVLNLAPTQLRVLRELATVSKTFFSLPQSDKDCCTFGVERYIGYHNRLDLCKEFFQVRETSKGVDIWPKGVPNFSKTALETFDALKSVAVSCLKMICTAVGMSEVYINSLIENGLGPDETTSQCALEIFNYHSSVTSVKRVIPCKDHSDIGLVGWELGKWLNIEVNAKEEYCVCFGGETLARVTNNYILPAIHQVAPIHDERLSMPFIMLARKHAKLDCSQLDRRIVGPTLPGFNDIVEAGDFVNDTSSKRISSLFKYQNISPTVL